MTYKMGWKTGWYLPNEIIVDDDFVRFVDFTTSDLNPALKDWLSQCTGKVDWGANYRGCRENFVFDFLFRRCQRSGHVQATLDRLMALGRLDKPHTATLEEWRQWRIDAKQQHPVRYYIQETLPLWVSCSLVRPCHEFKWWILHRIVPRYRYHVIKLKTLKPGYHDLDELLLHVSFDLLTDYVETGFSWKNVSWHKQHKPRWLPWFVWQKVVNRKRYGPIAGLDYLDWEITECKGTPQADGAAETKALYLWWTKERDLRIDPWLEPRIWNGIDLDQRPTTGTRAAGSMAAATQDVYAKQDQHMLMRLMQLRGTGYLWL